MLRTRAAAEIIGVHPDTMKEWRQKTQRLGRQIGPPYMKTETGRVYYDDAKLQQWIKERTVGA